MFCWFNAGSSTSFIPWTKRPCRGRNRFEGVQGNKIKIINLSNCYYYECSKQEWQKLSFSDQSKKFSHLIAWCFNSSKISSISTFTLVISRLKTFSSTCWFYWTFPCGFIASHDFHTVVQIVVTNANFITLVDHQASGLSSGLHPDHGDPGSGSLHGRRVQQSLPSECQNNQLHWGQRCSRLRGWWQTVLLQRGETVVRLQDIHQMVQ